MEQSLFTTEENRYIIVNGNIDIFKKEYEELTEEHRGREKSNYTNFFELLRGRLEKKGITFTEWPIQKYAFKDDNGFYLI